MDNNKIENTCDMLKNAKTYVHEKGWSVIPLEPKGKKPVIP